MLFYRVLHFGLFGCFNGLRAERAKRVKKERERERDRERENSEEEEETEGGQQRPHPTLSLFVFGIVVLLDFVLFFWLSSLRG